MRTHMTVSIGSAMILIAFLFGIKDVLSGRVAAQVVKIKLDPFFFAQLNLKSFDSKNRRIGITSAKMRYKIGFSGSRLFFYLSVYFSRLDWIKSTI